MKGIVALVRGGKTFVDQIYASCQALQIELYVISSKTVDDTLISNMSAKASVMKVIEQSELDEDSILGFVETLKKQNKQVLGCISVWENYRTLMSSVNKALSVQDMELEQVELLRDKFQLRQALRQHNLSHVNSRVLTETLFTQLVEEEADAFIKPRCGIASYGAFKLKPETKWQQITAIAEQIQTDVVFSTSFAQKVEFVVEDYIPGIEFCFEIIQHQGRCHVIAIHEKIEVGEQALTTLENVSASPPISLQRSEIESANAWVVSIFDRLQLGNGCYHLEAKFDGKQWEVIEINPRIGGSYINESVEHVSGYSLLELWIRSLLSEDSNDYLSLLKQLSPQSEHFFDRERGAYFRAFFAEPNKTIRKLQFNSDIPTVHQKLLMAAGQITPDANRELFVAQALWSWPVSQSREQIQKQIRRSESALEVEYE